MEKEKKWKIYPRDIIFALVSLAVLAYAVMYYLKAPTSMPLLKEYACLCGFGCVLSFTCMHGDFDEVVHFWGTHILSTFIWCAAAVIAYLTGPELITPQYHIPFLVCVYWIFIPVEFLIMGIVSLETRSSKEFADGPKCRRA